MTSSLVVDGGSPLVGDIEVRGAKNLVSKAMVAVMLAERDRVDTELIGRH